MMKSMNENLKKVIKDYIKNNLTIDVFVKSEYDIDLNRNVASSVEVKILLEDELISSNTDYF